MQVEPEIDLFRTLPQPADLFRGSNFSCRRMPDEVLVFFRGNREDAMAYGDIAHHHRFVLCLCFSTQGSVQVDANVFDLCPLESCLVFPYQPHHFTRFKDDKIAWLFISFEMRDSDWLEPLRNTIFSINDDAVSQLNRMVKNRMNQQGAMLPLQLALLFDHLLNSTAVDRKAIDARNPAAPLHLYGNLSSALRFIQQNLDAPLKVQDIVTQSGCSETVLRSLFETYLNISIAAYIRKMRILLACHLLATSNESIREISDLCGFSSQYAFSRTFKQVAGCSPNAYRRK